jgi:hypothetical protein
MPELEADEAAIYWIEFTESGVALLGHDSRGVIPFDTQPGDVDLGRGRGVGCLLDLGPAERFERFDNAGGMAAIAVAVRIEVSDRDSEEVWRADERSAERDEFVPVEPEWLWVADGGQHAFVEDVEIDV